MSLPVSNLGTIFIHVITFYMGLRTRLETGELLDPFHDHADPSCPQRMSTQ